MPRNLEEITRAYWEVRSAVHHPAAPAMPAGDALKAINKMDFLRPTDWKLSALMHETKYDIIEGNSEWRERRQVAGSVLTLRTKD